MDIRPAGEQTTQPITASSPSDVAATLNLDEKLEAAIQLLPSCQRCKRLRRKCDTNLPSCRLCLKASVECSFYDHSLQQVLPRSYVLSLLKRAQELKSRKSPKMTTTISVDMRQRQPTRELLPVRSDEPDLKSMNYDDHFMLSTASDRTFRFFGSSSVFVLTVQLASQIFDDPSQFKAPDFLSSLNRNEEGIIDSGAMVATRHSVPSKEMLSTLIGYYISTMNTLYPFIDESMIEADLQTYICDQNNDSKTKGRLSGKAAYQFFRISMMCAVACANKSRHKPHLSATDDDFYAKGLKYVEAVTSEVSGESLQALLLLILYCLFHPRKGDIWKLLDYACRLSVELGYHTELPLDQESSRDMALRRSTFWSLYTIERIVGQIFGRPSDLPEQIITTEYPGILVTGSPTDQASVQVFSAAHHYRLVYLRSEIYRDIYLPTKPPDHDLEWFIERYFSLLSWYEDVQMNEILAGVGTSTCNVAFNSTIVFLFQPLLLRALSQTTASSSETPVQIIASESYRCACGLIRTYENIMRAPDDTALGIYPMTIMSAHYIYLAGLTIMAYVQLSIEARVQILSPLEQGNPQRILQPMDYSDIFQISNSCLVLLTWCAQTWTGMSGMADMFRRMSEIFLPELARKGLA
ncbi:uncharacterized protein LY89DRAFT_747674 [Mollisia scopiformis]|uniref:Zn(2)-C6 fungal-type domain-containing protein n=1 Tax=Mollisia scopiformis TaxID=149040 RepID=A0A194XC97_MOLSC|nr:uncharacterized protein LY89DRAFT_747674 [Mollisia scopiformis]KUJ17790.1 hypothetical protein LY89DRAFT_747674 [Mollisia scopiformis]